MAQMNLPIHPTLCHPLTGQPLRALYVDRHGRARFPIMGASQDGAGNDGASDGDGGSSQTVHSDATWDTLKASWEDAGLSPAQISGRLEASRKWEQRAKNAPAPEEVATLREKAQRQDALEAELASETDKAARKAREDTQAEADARYRPMLAETAFRVAIADRKPQNEVDDFIADLNLTRFLKDDGNVDTAKVLARVEQFAPVKGTQQRGPVLPRGGAGSGSGGSGAGLSNLTGRELYERLHPKKSTA